MKSADTVRRGSRSPTRVSGVDAARGLALLGMMTVHVLPTTDEWTNDPTWAGMLFTGRPAALFALLAGVGLALYSSGGGRRSHSPLGRRTPAITPEDEARLSHARKVIAVRALLIVVIGMAVAMMSSGVAIILVHYGLLFLLALPFLRLGAKTLFGLAAGWAALAPAAFWWLHNDLRLRLEGFPNDWRLWSSPTFSDLSDPPLLGMDLALTGYYPLLIWPAYLFAGMAVGRLRLDRTSTALNLAGAGAILAGAAYLVSRAVMPGVAGRMAEQYAVEERYLRGELLTGTHQIPLVTDSWWFGLATPHQGSTADLVHTIGCALLVLGLCLLVTERLRWILAPLIGAGAMPLSLYVGHLVVLHLWRGTDDDGSPVAGSPALLREYGESAMIAGLVLGALALGLVKVLLRRRGPLEALTHGISASVAGPRP